MGSRRLHLGGFLDADEMTMGVTDFVAGGPASVLVDFPVPISSGPLLLVLLDLGFAVLLLLLNDFGFFGRQGQCRGGDEQAAIEFSGS